MLLNEKEHKDQMNRVEEKFFEEKMRLQKEANKKIDELAEKAHEAAIKLVKLKGHLRTLKLEYYEH